MPERYKLIPSPQGWTIMVREGAGAVTQAAWVSLGGCPSHMTALRVYLALKAGGGR